MNISGGKGVLKFFSKNKKGVSEESEEKFPNAYTMRIRKEDKTIHAEAICADGKLYSTKNAEIIFLIKNIVQKSDIHFIPEELIL